VSWSSSWCWWASRASFTDFGVPRALGPRRALVRLLLSLEERDRPIVVKDIARAAKRYPRALPHEQLEHELQAAVDDLLVLVDHRIFFDRATGRVEPGLVYRVNRRHPLAREELA
jgi:hypothetical protein